MPQRPLLRVRRAGRADLSSILVLMADDALALAAVDPNELRLYEEAFDDIDADPRDGLYVAERDGAVVGTFQLTVLRHLGFLGARVAQIESVHVHSTSRGEGVGTEMMRWAIEEASRRGCRRVQLTSQKVRVDAHRFYERLGFVRSHEGMKLDLSSRRE